MQNGVPYTVTGTIILQGDKIPEIIQLLKMEFRDHNLPWKRNSLKSGKYIVFYRIICFKVKHKTYMACSLYYCTDSGHDAEFDCGDGRGTCRPASRGHRPRQRVGFDAADGMARVAEIQMHHGLRNVSRRMCQVCEHRE